MIMKLHNPNPTDVEKQLFRYGYYVIKNDTLTHSNGDIEYVPVHIDRAVLYYGDEKVINPKTDVSKTPFPDAIEIEADVIEWENNIIFDTLLENVNTRTLLDLNLILLIEKRMCELGFKSTVQNKTVNDKEELTRLLSILGDIPCVKHIDCFNCWYQQTPKCRTKALADYLIKNGVTIKST